MIDTRREGLVEAIGRAADGLSMHPSDPERIIDRRARLLREHAADLEALGPWFGWLLADGRHVPTASRAALDRIASRPTNGGERDDG